MGQTNTLADDNTPSMDEVSLSASASITVTIPADAAIGTSYTITLSGSYDNASGEHPISETKTITVVEKPVSTPGPDPTPTPAPTGWALTAIDVAAMAQGGSYDFTVTDDATVPAAVLASLKEKQGVLNVIFGGYTCTINGALLGTIPEGLAGIDLGLSMEKDAALSALVGGADAYQLHFNHSGALPGRFTFRFKADQNSPGDTVYLYYYYDASGVVEGVQTCVVDAEGYISVDIYHCSSYIISKALIEGAAGIVVQPEPTPTPTPEPSPTATPPAATTAAVDKPVQSEGLTVSASSPVEQWFGVPYAPLITALLGAALLAMLLTMLFTRSGLFKKRSAPVVYFGPEAPDVPADEPDDSEADNDGPDDGETDNDEPDDGEQKDDEY